MPFADERGPAPKQSIEEGGSSSGIATFATDAQNALRIAISKNKRPLSLPLVPG